MENTVTENSESEHIEIGDQVVILKVPIKSNIYTCMCEEVHVFFTESGKLKGVVVGIK